MTRRTEPWLTYAKWLTDNRGLGSTTVSTYLTLARRVIRNSGHPLTAEGIGAWIDSLPSHHRSPHRAAYRAFAEWSLVQGHTVPAIPRAHIALSDEALAGLDAFLRAGLTARTIAGLRWDIDNSPAKRAAFPDRVFIRVDTEEGSALAAVPADAAEAVRRWAYGDVTPEPTDPVVPRALGAKEPIPYGVLLRLLRRRD